MPYLPLSSQIPGLRLGAWHIAEPEIYFLTRVKLYENEWQRLGKINHPRKRLEWLSSRLCLKELLSIANHQRVESLSSAEGKPYLSNASHFISYSHSNFYSAAIASPQHEVGIDLEYLGHKRNLETRFLWQNERELAVFGRNASIERFLLMWSAKETLYKIFGRRGLRFKEDIHLQLEGHSLSSHGAFPADLQFQGQQFRYTLHYLFAQEFVLTYTSARTFRQGQQALATQAKEQA